MLEINSEEYEDLEKINAKYYVYMTLVDGEYDKDVKHPESDVSGWLALYQKLVHSADTGAILR